MYHVNRKKKTVSWETKENLSVSFRLFAAGADEYVRTWFRPICPPHTASSAGLQRSLYNFMNNYKQKTDMRLIGCTRKIWSKATSVHGGYLPVASHCGMNSRRRLNVKLIVCPMSHRFLGYQDYSFGLDELAHVQPGGLFATRNGSRT